MRATYKGMSKSTYTTTYPSWTFDATKGEDMSGLVKALKDSFGFNRSVSFSGFGTCVNPDTALKVTYLGCYGVTNWKNKVRRIYTEWKNER